MFKKNPKVFLKKQLTMYDIETPVMTFEERHSILKRLTYFYPKLRVKGGTTKTNPYKVHYDVILAERRYAIDYYKDSILWSPKYTPWHFWNLFFFPSIFVLFFLFYWRHVAVPKRMMQFKKKKGLIFPDLEKKGWLDDWIDEEFIEEDNMEYNYSDWTLADIQKFEKEHFKKKNVETNKMKEKYREKMEKKFNELAKLKIKN